jgi:hypothetical protein
MPYDAPGKRIEVVWPGGANGTTPIHTNRFAVVDNKVLLLTKTGQIDRFVRPDSAPAVEIQPNETCVGFQGGVHELLLDGTLGLGNLSKGDKLWIDAATNAILTSGGGGTGGAPANEKQSLKVEGTGGTFKLTWEGAQTTAIKFNASAAEVQAALEALATINVGDVTVTGGPGNELGTTPYVVLFGGRFADTDVPAITADSTALTGGNHVVTITTTTAGAGSSDTALPLGVVDEIDATRTPHVARVNTDAWHAFITS